jgi:hypothetical protein
MDQHPGALEMTHRQIADAVGCSITLVARMKRATGGYVPRPYTRRKDSLGRVEEPDLDAKEPEVAKVVESPSLSTDAKRKLLTRLAESDDSRTEARISAIRELHRIDESVGSAKELGPGPPLTVEDRVSRLSLLIAACGPTVHAAALALAQKEWE